MQPTSPRFCTRPRASTTRWCAASLCLLDGTRDRAVLADAPKAEYPALPAGQIEQGIEPILKLFHRAGVLDA
jgi:hypothetical protein